MSKFPALSIIVPTKNEEKNIPHLLERIDQTMTEHNIRYEVIVIDDFSNDGTKKATELLYNSYPVRFYYKKGRAGKAYSLLEGFSYAKYPVLAMIDADLQYPPESIPEMINHLTDEIGVVVADRRYKNVKLSRKIISLSFRKIFSNFLHNIPHDVQSGLKVFKKEIIYRIRINPSPWTFDLDFLLQAENAGYAIDSVPIDFYERTQGKSKVHTIKSSIEIGWSSIKSKLKGFKVVNFLERNDNSPPGFHYRGREFIHYSNLRPNQSAVYTLTPHQRNILLLSLGIGEVLFLFSPHGSIVFILGILTLLYIADLVFQLVLISKNFVSAAQLDVSEKEIALLNDESLPLYTILCPLYNESSVLSQFLSAMDKLDYPKNKLQVILLLEEDDKTTRQALSRVMLLSHIEICVVPPTSPQTKPKACNVGLQLARGEFTVIFDAEDVPEPDQLKKVFYAFAHEPKSVQCVQAKLTFYNTRQNLLTKLFTTEYNLWFDLILPGLQSVSAPIPLGGTSNHFRTEILRELGGWDSFNVTEDCDLGIRLKKKNYQTIIINSKTFEEANSDFMNWIHQRSRWVKGYIQTYLVHMRDLHEIDRTNVKSFLGLQLIVGGKILSLFINPLLWALSILYFLFRPTLGQAIESFFPAPIFYLGILSFVFGNFLYFYYYMIACAKTKNDNLIKFGFLIPFYWLMMSIASYIGLYRLIKSPYHWSKTKHGLHIQPSEKNAFA